MANEIISNLKERAKKLKTDIPAVFLALKDKRTPWYAKLIAAIAVAYALSPIDLIPDFIPFFGYLDDLLILPSLVAAFIKLVPAEVFEEARVQSNNMWKDGKPKKWYYAIPIILFWMLIVLLILKLIFKNKKVQSVI